MSGKVCHSTTQWFWKLGESQTLSRIAGTWTHYNLVCDFTGFMNCFMAIQKSHEALFQVQIHSLSSLSSPCVPSSPTYLICSATFTSIHAAVFPFISSIFQSIIPPICLDLFNHLYSSIILPTHLAFILPLIHWSVCHPTCSSFPPNPLHSSISICSTIHLIHTTISEPINHLNHCPSFIGFCWVLVLQNFKDSSMLTPNWIRFEILRKVWPPSVRFLLANTPTFMNILVLVLTHT